MIQDIHVRILEWGKEKEIFTLGEILSAFPDEKDLINLEIINSRLFSPIDEDITQDSRLMLSFEDRFRLLDYEELHEARKSSKRAMTFAIVSIFLTLCTLLFSIYHSNEVIILERPSQTVSRDQNKSNLKNAAIERKQKIQELKKQNPKLMELSRKNNK